jgi:hypothetical protein
MIAIIQQIIYESTIYCHRKSPENQQILRAGVPSFRNSGQEKAKSGERETFIFFLFSSRLKPLLFIDLFGVPVFLTRQPCISGFCYIVPQEQKIL